MSGLRDRFRNLVSWDALNSILETHLLEPPRFRLVKDGVVSDPRTTPDHLHERRGERMPWLDPAELQRQLREGATIAVNGMDEMHPPVRALCEDLTRNLKCHFQANLFASFGSSASFGAHWDGHDVFIVQVAGRKHWTLFGPNSSHGDRCPEEVAWDGLLESGDVLYMPRGTWHDVRAVNEPSLHLTIGGINRTGAHFMDWLIRQVRDEPLFRQDLPRFQSVEMRRAHVEALASTVLARVTLAGLDQFLRDQVARIPQRTYLSMPDLARTDRASLPDNSKIRLSGPALPDVIDEHPNGVDVQRAGARRRYPYWMIPVLRLLWDGKVHSVRNLLSAAVEAPSLELAREGIRILLDDGIAHLIRSGTSLEPTASLVEGSSGDARANSLNVELDGGWNEPAGGGFGRR